MKVNEFISKLFDIVNNYNTVYLWGAFGRPVTDSNILSLANQYPSWYTTEKQAKFRELIGKNYFGFDCVNLIKAIMWGWNGDFSKTHGGSVYKSNGVPDINADSMINLCDNVSNDFSNIEVGEAVWLKGHIGIYVGLGKAIEATPSWSGNVQVTAVGNIGKIPGLNTRNWTSHGKFPFIDYTLEKAIDHWALDPWKYLIENEVIIHEQRFDDKLTRGECFVLLEQILKKMKRISD